MISHKHLCAFKLCANKNWQPTGLDVWDQRIPLKQSIVVFRLLLQKAGCRPIPRARPTPSRLALNWDLQISPPHNRAWVLHSCCHRQMVDSTGILAAAIPDLGLPKIDVDVGVPLQLLAGNLEHRCHTIGSTKLMSSKKATIFSEFSNRSEIDFKLLCTPKLNGNGMSGSPCSPPSP